MVVLTLEQSQTLFGVEVKLGIIVVLASSLVFNAHLLVIENISLIWLRQETIKIIGLICNN